MVRSLNTKWKEFLFAFSGFGPNFLMVLMGAYFTDAINPTALIGNNTAPVYQAFAGGACFILPAIFPILYAISKAFDGIIDIPFAYITDNLSTRWGRRRPAIVVCFIPMVLSFAMCWWPVFGPDEKYQLHNTIWVIVWSLIFFSTYTMCLIAFYGSLSTTCTDEPQRLRVSGYKSFFDTISYCLVYALVPIILEGAKLHIDKFVFLCLPLMLTMLIPLFLIKEGAKYGYPENNGLSGEKVSLWESLKLTFKNAIFRRWTYVNCCTYFGLQMFLVGMNAMIIGGMGFNGAEMALLNTCAFAPVPIMLYFFNKLKAKKGVRFTYQTCLLSFAVAILSFFFGSLLVTGGNKPLQYLIGCFGSVLGSWAIGAFFMMPYLAPAQISSVEEKLTGKNHSAMYFAGNCVTTSIIGAISGSLVYENIKNFFFSTEASGIVHATATESASGAEIAAELLGVSVDKVFNFGTTIVPFIVAAVCVIGFFLAFKMPRDYTPTEIAKELKRLDPSLDITGIEAEEVPAEKGEIIFVQIGLSVLSGFIFSFAWVGMLLKSVKDMTGKGIVALYWALSCFVPFLSIPVLLLTDKALCDEAKATGLAMKRSTVLLIVSSVICVLLPINLVALGVLQKKLNKLYAHELAEVNDGVSV